MTDADATPNDEPSKLALDPSDDPKADKAQGLVAELAEIGKTVFYALAIALVLRIVFFQPYTIPSESMVPNLLKNDYIIVSKFSYGWSRHSIPFSPPIFEGRLMGREPKRGDVVVFKYPPDGRKDYIKRLIGLPGDTVQITNGEVTINGVLLKQERVGPDPISGATRVMETNQDGKTYITNDLGYGYAADNTAVYRVPEGCYFMMGDNRDNSSDSRFDPGVIAKGMASCEWDPAYDYAVGNSEGVGFVPYENLEGRAQMILLSWGEGVSLFKPWTWVTEARPERFFKSLR